MSAKKIVSTYVLLSYPNFSEEFIIHEDAIKVHLGGVIRQIFKPIYFYPRKVTPPQINYITEEIELLSLV